MGMNIKDIIESINLLTEEGIEEETLQDVPETEPEIAPEVKPEEPAFNDTMSLADTFDAKAKIARCLDNLKIAVDEFKEATAEKVDLLKDELLLTSIEDLDEVVKAIELALASGSNILGDTGLNDAFNNELPQAEEEPVEDEVKEEPVETEEDEEDEIADIDFDSEAGFDLLGGEV
jgi:hypothetical protein